MKRIFQAFWLCLFLFFTAGGSSYALDLNLQSDRAEDPFSKHQLELGHLNDQALGAVEFVLTSPENRVQPQEDTTTPFVPFCFYRSSPVNLHFYADQESNYIKASALIIPGLSSLQQIFPFHLFP
ncbi:hypothetical protein [Leeuwenhoekiella parthenopeia]|uniref:Uncharacterized protein n=1 Tax=Leeuwenhoekiella parthenopeia TaxID=2890320 RepID=A0ABS8GXK0_9FLAO|nr:hypothetical protein [Leeuwenhoekiella parthenopeia]MCC4214526.1 hypothetical protein [Leeuwenhoekiella parthenopeia]